MSIHYSGKRLPESVADIQVNDVIQLDPETTHNKMFGGCLAIVSEVKGWGVQCYVRVPGASEWGPDAPGDAYYRAEWKTFVLIGRAEWFVERHGG